MAPGPVTLAFLSLGGRAGALTGAPMLAGAALTRAAARAAAAGLANRIARADPMVFAVPKAMEIALVLRVAWRLVATSPPGPGALPPDRGSRLFARGASIAASNPVAWLGALMAATLFHDPASSAAAQAAAFAVASGVGALLGWGAWLVAGALLRRRLASERARRALSMGGAGLLLASLGAAF